MRLRDYVIFGCASCLLSALSLLLWPINALTMLFLALGALPWTLAGELSPASGFGGLRPVIGVSVLWPLTLAPLHWVTYRWLRRRWWTYVGLLLVVNVAFAFVILVLNDNS